MAEQFTNIPNIVNMNQNEKNFDHHELPTFRLITNTSSNINDNASSCLQNNVTPESHGKLFKIFIYKLVPNELKQDTRCFHMTLTLCKNYFFLTNYFIINVCKSLDSFSSQLNIVR